MPEHPDHRVLLFGGRGFPDIPGGVETHMEQLSQRLPAHGFAVTVVGRRGYLGARAPFSPYPHVTVHPAHHLRGPAAEHITHGLAALRLARRTRPHLLHAHGIAAGLTLWLFRSLRLPVVATVHSLDYLNSKWGIPGRMLLRLGARLLVKAADVVICVADHILASLGNPHHGVVLPNGIGPEFLGPVEEAHRRRLALLYVGRFAPEKGVPQLISWAAHIQPYHLRLIGRPVRSWEYTAASATPPNVQFLGPRYGKTLRSSFSDAVALVNNSSYEGHPISILEALAVGVPVVATSIPAHHEIATLTDRLFLFPRNDLTGFLSAVRAAASAWGRPDGAAKDAARIRERFSWERIARDTVAVYRRLLHVR